MRRCSCDVSILGAVDIFDFDRLPDLDVALCGFGFTEASSLHPLESVGQYQNN